MTQRRIYQTEYPYFVTTVVRDREPAFHDPTLAVHLAETILGACALKSFDVHAWAILPDHVHLLVAKSLLPSFDSRTHNGVRCVGELKISPHTHRGLSRTCDNVRSGLGNDPTTNPQRGLLYPRWLQPNGMNPFADISELMKCIKGSFAHDIGDIPFWQRRFYTRIVTTERQYGNTVSYILHNRAKHGLPERYARRPYVHITRSDHKHTAQVF